MFIRRIGRKDGSTLVRIVENVRDGERVRQKVVTTVGKAKNQQELMELERLGKSQIVAALNERDPVLPGFEDAVHGTNGVGPVDAKRSPDSAALDIFGIKEVKRLNVGMSDVFGQVYEQLGFSDLIRGTRKDEEWNEIVKQTVLSRIFDPTSKRRASLETLRDLGEEVPLEKIYRMMDRLARSEEGIKARICQSALGLLDFTVDVLFFDVTTLYFESFDEDELRAFGFSKDCKFKETQIVLALVTNEKGVPITYELFPGNQHEGGTLVEIVKKLKSTYQIRNVVMVADRAMFTEANLSLLEAEKIDYIVAAKLKAMKKEVQSQFLPEPKAVGEDPLQAISGQGWIKEIALEKRRLIVSYDPDRARKDCTQRMRLVERLSKKAKNGKIPLKTLINNNGTKKYIEVSGDGAEVKINEAKIASDAVWDGIHGVITSFAANERTPKEILERYRGLWKIEEVFRINKNDLKMRPIYHFKSSRIRAHILLCFIAYVMTNFARLMLERADLKLSLHELRREVSKRQVSIIRDTRTQRRYLVPSAFTDKQRLIYRALQIRIIEKVQPLFNT